MFLVGQVFLHGVHRAGQFAYGLLDHLNTQVGAQALAWGNVRGDHHLFGFGQGHLVKTFHVARSFHGAIISWENEEVYHDRTPRSDPLCAAKPRVTIRSELLPACDGLTAENGAIEDGGCAMVRADDTTTSMRKGGASCWLC